MLKEISLAVALALAASAAGAGLGSSTALFRYCPINAAMGRNFSGAVLF